MSDKEMFELAAKAAGIALEFRVLIWSDGTEYPCYEDKDSVSEAANCVPVIRWNPLTDDGDALRLAVKLYFKIVHDGEMQRVECHYSENENDWLTEDWKDDPQSATRRAIVRAAAEIGRVMK